MLSLKRLLKRKGPRPPKEGAKDLDRRILCDVLELAPEGPRIELGVHKGKALQIIAQHRGSTFGVDSFEGMANPTENDLDSTGGHQYPKGKLAIGMEEARRRAPKAELIQGFIPEVLAVLPQGPFAFAHVDLDQYAPTRASLEWLFPRMITGGIVLCHDWFDGRDFLAGGAINEFARQRNARSLRVVGSTRLAVQKSWRGPGCGRAPSIACRPRSRND
jgi:hypothetical protein